MSEAVQKNRVLGIILLLIVCVFAAYGPATGFDFINLDDETYVTENEFVLEGLSKAGVKRIFSTPVAGNWHPVTMLSHAADVHFFGLDAGKHHRTNIIIHLFNVLLLFTFLYQSTGARWRSGVVALLFAVHPLGVEVVAWVSQRKTLLSTFFMLLTFIFYRSYSNKQTTWRYLLVLVSFCLALMAKATVVIIPVLLLLLDFWPLNRYGKGGRSFRAILVEKVPFLLLAFVIGGITIFTQHQVGAMSSLDTLPFHIRLFNAVLSSFRYIDRAIWPAGLSVFYPYSGEAFSIARVSILAAALIAMTAFVLYYSSSHKYLPVGWLWYLTVLLPVLGLIQVGGQSAADRYGYQSLIGIFVLTVWGLTEWSRERAVLRRAISITALCSIILLAIVCRIQASHWKNNFTLYSHSIKTVPDNYLCHNNLGIALKDEGRLEEAMAHFQTAAKIKPNWVFSFLNMAEVFSHQEKYEYALAAYQQALQLGHQEPLVHHQLGKFLLQTGNLEDAAYHFREALLSHPIHAEAHSNLGFVLARMGRPAEALVEFDQAIKYLPYKPDIYINKGLAHIELQQLGNARGAFEKSLRLNPENAQAHASLAYVLESFDEYSSAVEHYTQALEIFPDYAEALNGLAWLKAARTGDFRDPQRALQLATKACELTGFGRPDALDTLAVAYAAAGDFANAQETARKASELADVLGDEQAKADIQSRLALFENGQPYVEK